jgi:hypothetical protein
MLRPPCPDDLRRDRDASTGQATYPLGPGSLDREPTLPDLDGARTLLADALALPDLPDDVRDQLAERLVPPSAEEFCTYPGDVREHVLTGRACGPTLTLERPTAVVVKYFPDTDRTLVGWTMRRVTLAQIATARVLHLEAPRA